MLFLITFSIVTNPVKAADNCPASIISIDTVWGDEEMTDGKFDCSETDLVIDGATLFLEFEDEVSTESLMKVRNLTYQNGGMIKTQVEKSSLQKGLESIVGKEVAKVISKAVEWALDATFEVIKSPYLLSQAIATTALALQIASYGVIFAVTNANIPNVVGIIGQVLFGRLSKKKLWGVVFDSRSSQPVPFAVVRLYDAISKKLIQTSVTDLDGRYGFPPEEGTFNMQVSHDEYIFPSRLTETDIGGGKENLYAGGEFSLKGNTAIDFSIPLDSKDLKLQIGKDLFLLIKSRLKKFFLEGNIYLTVSMLILNIILLLVQYSTLSFVLFVVYLVMSILMILVRLKKPRTWGKVFDSVTNAAVSTAFVKLFSEDGKKLVDTKITDSKGRFSFFVPKGNYQLLVAVQNYKFPSQNTPKSTLGQLGSLIMVSALQGVLNIDIPVDPVGSPPSNNTSSEDLDAKSTN